MADLGRLKHLDGGLLERNIGTTVKVGTARANGLDELLGADNPSNTPTRKTESLGKTVNDQDIVLVDIDNVVCGRNDATITIGSVIVTTYVISIREFLRSSFPHELTVEFVHDQSSPLTANVLDLGKLRVGHDLAGRITRVGGQNNGGTTGNFLSNFLRVDVVVVVAGERNWDRGEVLEER